MMNGLVRLLKRMLFFPVAAAIGLPVLAALGLVMLVSLPKRLWDNYKWKRKLGQSGRFRNRCLDTSCIDSGTLIIDSPALGWALHQCWWTPDDIRVKCPYSIPTPEDRDSRNASETDQLEFPFDVWIYEHYLNEDSGSAILLATRHGDRLAKKIKATGVKVTSVQSWSAPVKMRRSLRGKNGVQETKTNE